MVNFILNENTNMRFKAEADLDFGSIHLAAGGDYTLLAADIAKLNTTRMQTLQRQMFRWQAENDAPIPIISKSNYKWCILYNSKSTPEIHVNMKLSDAGFLPYFSTREKAEECIEVFKDELIWLFTEFRWRMDD